MVIDRTYLDMIKTYDEPTTNVILSGKKINTFPLITGTRQKCFAFLTFIEYTMASLSQRN